jgi:chromosome partitioning protein
VFLDGPPAFLTLVQEMVQVADFAIIPVKASTLDILATQDAVVLAQESGTPFICVINDVGRDDGKFVESGKRTLLNMGIPIAATEIKHRISHIAGMNCGKTAAEVNKGNDKAAAKEINDLWEEIKPLAMKAAKARAKRQQVTADV